jgi:hypothetical protein
MAVAAGKGVNTVSLAVEVVAAVEALVIPGKCRQMVRHQKQDCIAG